MDMTQMKAKAEQRLSLIKNKIIVLSNKGGVGKSTTTAMLASFLHQQGHQVGLLDIDLHGPSQLKLFGKSGQKIEGLEDGSMLPLEIRPGFKLISTAGLTSEEKALVWRGPIKAGLIMQFLGTVEWGELDYLLLDSPPGTGDEPLTAIQNTPEIKALLVTTPQEMALIDTKKAVDFLKQLEVPIIGVIENMATAICPNCNQKMNLFKLNDSPLDIGVENSYEIPFIRSLLEAAEQGAIYEAVQDNEQINNYLAKLNI